MMMLILIFLWPYLLLAVMAWEKKRRGLGPHDLAGLVGAGAGLLFMTAALVIFPFIHTWATGDRTANIGWGLLCLGSIVYCYAFLMMGFWLGKAIGARRARKRTPNKVSETTSLRSEVQR